MARRAAKVDDTHGEIRNALRAAGVVLHDCSMVGRGFPDFVCSYRGYTALLECKTGFRDLNEPQRKFRDKWEGTMIVARTGPEAVEKFFQEYAVSLLKKI